MTLPAHDLTDARLEAELRTAFASGTADLPPTRDPWGRMARAIARSRARRRTGAVATLLVAALVAVAGSLLPVRHGTARPARPKPGPVVTSHDATTWPTRGSLAGRADVVAQVREEVAQDDGTVLAVPYVGEVGGLAVALALVDALDDDGHHERRLVSLSGTTSGVKPTWNVSSTSTPLSSVDADAAPALSAALAGDDGLVRMVVVTVSNVTSAAYSPRPEIDAAGRIGRRFTAIPLENGVGTVAWSGSPVAATLRLQENDGVPLIGAFDAVSLSPAETRPSQARPVPPVETASCRGRAFETVRLNLLNAASDVARKAGRAPGDVREVRGVWCRHVGRHALMFVAVRLADGTALQTVMQDIRESGGHAFPDQDGWAAPPGREATYPRYVELSDVGDDTNDLAARTALLFAPGGATAELVQGTGPTPGVLVHARLDPDGVGVGTARAKLPFPTKDGVELFVVVRDGAGRELERVRVPPREDAWGTAFDGPVTGG